jgi:hypothetical protein
MSRNGSGVYSLPAGSTVTNGDTSDATDLNSPLADLEADMNIPRPMVAGGTGASSAAAALVNFGLTATAAEINVLDGITATVTELNYTDGVTSAIQTQLDAKQPLESDLTAIAALASTGIAVRTASNTWAQRTITSGDSSVSITNPGGVAGNIDLSVDVAGETAGLSAGAVGSYAFLRFATPSSENVDSTHAGSGLRYSNADADSGTTPSGTWRLMGVTGADAGSSTSLFLRIS